jgi:hypothetical protein
MKTSRLGLSVVVRALRRLALSLAFVGVLAPMSRAGLECKDSCSSLSRCDEACDMESGPSTCGSFKVGGKCSSTIVRCEADPFDTTKANGCVTANCGRECTSLNNFNSVCSTCSVGGGTAGSSTSAFDAALFCGASSQAIPSGVGRLTIWDNIGLVAAGKCTAALITPEFFIVPSSCIANQTMVSNDATVWATWAATISGTAWFPNDAAAVDKIVSVGRTGIAVGHLRWAIKNKQITPLSIPAVPLKNPDNDIIISGYGFSPQSNPCPQRLSSPLHNAFPPNPTIPQANFEWEDRGAVAFRDNNVGFSVALGANATSWVDVTRIREQIFSMVRALDSGFEHGVDRLGFDLSGGASTLENPMACQAACERDPRCAAFSYVQTTKACFLKSALAPPIVHTTIARSVTSGVPRERGNFGAAAGVTLEACGAGTAVDADSCQAQCADTGDAHGGNTNFVFHPRKVTVGGLPITFKFCDSITSFLNTGVANATDVSGTLRTEFGFNRQDTSTLTLVGSDPVANSPLQCARSCALNSNCQSWVLKGFQPEITRCFFYSGTANPVPPSGFVISQPVSGVRRGIDYNVDRAGSDYSVFDLNGATPDPGPVPNRCQASCEADSRCKAWAAQTFVLNLLNPSPRGRCWLKSAVPAQRAGMFGITSGVKGGFKN